MTVCYDPFIILRKVFRHSYIFEYFEDFLFFIFAIPVTIIYLYTENHGRIRLYAIIGAGLGIWIYKKTLEVPLVAMGVWLLRKIRWTVTLPICLIKNLSKSGKRLAKEKGTDYNNNKREGDPVEE